MLGVGVESTHLPEVVLDRGRHETQEWDSGKNQPSFREGLQVWNLQGDANGHSHHLQK